jgi:hypothetical protein
VIEQVTADLDQAAHRLGNAGDGARFRVLIERIDPALEAWIADNAFELVLLPARPRPLGRPRHPAARRIRRRALAEVRVLKPGPR